MKAEPEGGPRPSTEQKLERLLEAAAGLMARQGYSQTTIRDVARESGFSLAGMYYYFTSKEDLLHKIQHRTFSRLIREQEREQQTLQGRSPEQRLENLIRCHLAFFTRHAAELKVCTFELESLGGEAYQSIETLRRRYFHLAAEMVSDVLSVEATAPAVRHLTLFIFGMLNWVFMWYQPERDSPFEELGQEMAQFVLGGIAAKRQQMEAR